MRNQTNRHHLTIAIPRGITVRVRPVVGGSPAAFGPVVVHDMVWMP